jgi:hypothetical protein
MFPYWMGQTRHLFCLSLTPCHLHIFFTHLLTPSPREDIATGRGRVLKSYNCLAALAENISWVNGKELIVVAGPSHLLKSWLCSDVTSVSVSDHLFFFQFVSHPGERGVLWIKILKYQSSAVNLALLFPFPHRERDLMEGSSFVGMELVSNFTGPGQEGRQKAGCLVKGGHLADRPLSQV